MILMILLEARPRAGAIKATPATDLMVFPAVPDHSRPQVRLASSCHPCLGFGSRGLVVRSLRHLPWGSCRQAMKFRCSAAGNRRLQDPTPVERARTVTRMAGVLNHAGSCQPFLPELIDKSVLIRICRAAWFPLFSMNRHPAHCRSAWATRGLASHTALPKMVGTVFYPTTSLRQCHAILRPRTLVRGNEIIRKNRTIGSTGYARKGRPTFCHQGNAGDPNVPIFTHPLASASEVTAWENGIHPVVPFRWFRLSEQIDRRGRNGMNSVLRTPKLPTPRGSERAGRMAIGRKACSLFTLHLLSI